MASLRLVASALVLGAVLFGVPFVGGYALAHLLTDAPAGVTP